MAKKNFYAVKNGNETGIFTSWDECKKAVSGYSGAEYKGFATKEEAEEYLGGETPPSTKKEKNMKTTDTEVDMKSVPIGEAIAYVDGSYNKELKIYGLGIVFITSALYEEISKSGNDPVMLKMWNVAGETEAAMAAIQEAINLGCKTLTIYHDYTGIAGWADDWEADKEGSKRYKKFVKKAKEKIELKFVKVKAHTGNKYNEIADRLAKKGCKIL